MYRCRLIVCCMCVMVRAAVGGPPAAEVSFVNWDTAQVHPLDMTPDGSKLLAVNTADGRLEVFDVTGATPVSVASVPVGVAPVSVRARTNLEAWVVNHISDSISIVNLATLNVVDSISTLDEPTDVVFAGGEHRAFVSCSQANTVQVFDPDNRAAPPTNVPIDAEDPRALAVSPDGQTVYVAIFESGNATTILGGGTEDGPLLFPPNIVSQADGPHGGVNPPPNAGDTFDPPIGALLPPPPAVGLIVRKDDAGRWMDDNDGDWTEVVTGTQAHRSGRLVGWDLPDRDVAMIDTGTLQVSYVSRLMNICMAMGVNPATGEVAVVGTDAMNHVRFLSNAKGRFLRVNLARFVPGSDGVVTDLNPHLDYLASTIPQAMRDQSIGDPRGIVFNAAGARGYVSGMGSNNVVVIDASGARSGLAPTIEVGEGPTGLALDESRNRLYVLNRFAASVSVVDTVAEIQVAQVPFFDPTPDVIRTGRRHMYDTHETSGLGHIACASCHVDARMDRLAWDLGDPTGTVKTFNQNCNFGLDLGVPCEDWHPMKGPMLTQTMQDVIGKEPHHWRGDSDGIEQFSPAFVVLHGDDEIPTAEDMQEFKAYLATISYGPNPFRNLDNSLPVDLSLEGHFTTGRFAPAGQPLPNGNPQRGLEAYLRPGIGPAGTRCASCHTLPTGAGTNLYADNGQIMPFPPGPNGEQHLSIISITGSTNVSMKTPQLRNAYERVGSDLTQVSNNTGFGFLHDGAVDSIARMVAVFNVQSDQEIADIVSFVLCMSGSDLPVGNDTDVLELRGPDSLDTHAAVGAQVTITGSNRDDAQTIERVAVMRTLADAGAVGLVAKGVLNGEARGFYYDPPHGMQSDRAIEQMAVDDLRFSADTGSEVTFTVVPAGSAVRIGVDRDEDGFFDRDEIDLCADPADAASDPTNVVVTGDQDTDADVDVFDFAGFAACAADAKGGTSVGCRCAFDFNTDGGIDLADFQQFQIVFCGSSCP
ncbi:MAG: beta-propeller fold lactonase family protein [Phycisphaerae bacterium]